MSKTFAEVLERVRVQANVLNRLEERAVELGVIIPVLRTLAWDTDLVTEVYPQQIIRMSNKAGGYGQVDYALQIDRKCKVLLEVKRWSVELVREHEEQLSKYCTAAAANAAATELAVLTNGRQWKFYRTRWSRLGAPPLDVLPIGKISEFLTFDIVDGDPAEVECNFRKYLQREQFLDKRGY